MDTFWQKRLEKTGRQNTNLLAIPNLFAPREPSAPQVIQPKLTVGEPGDQYEQEADRVAEQVVHQISPPITQQPNRGNTLQREEMLEGEALQSKSIAVTKSPEAVQRVNIKNPFKSRRTNQPPAAPASQAAHLLDVNLAARPIISDGYGHSMVFSIGIDAGSNPTGETYNADEVSDRPHSLHGVSLEYWERIEVLYDFEAGMAVFPDEIQQRKQEQEGKSIKPFSDIYAYNPRALTFYGWRTAAEAASRGELTGKQTIQFVDRPRVHSRDNRYIKRLLQFRVVFKDTHGNRQEISASQIVEIADQQLVNLSYHDSAGNSMAIGGQVVPYQDTKGMFGGDYPATVSTTLPEFVRRITNGNAVNFQDRESEQIAQRIGQNPANVDLASQRTTSELGRLYRDMVRTNAGMEGKAGLPLPKAGQEYREYAFSDGLLVALVQGTNIIKTYYTNNTTQTVQLRGNQGQPFNIEARSFEEIPYNRPMTLI
jgi:hypothetical protein